MRMKFCLLIGVLIITVLIGQAALLIAGPEEIGFSLTLKKK